MIQVFDNLFDKNLVNQIYNELKKFDYLPGETDIPGYPPTGQIITLEKNSSLVEIITNKISHILPNKQIVRAYSNIFKPNENPYFHEDGKVLTAIYYANTEIGYRDIKKLDEGGETQFYIKERDEILGVQPYTGRLILFDGQIFHRGTPFRSFDRYNIVIKYDNINKGIER